MSVLRRVNVRTQEKEIVVSVVLVIVGRGEVTWHSCGRLATENAVCVPVRTVLASRSTVHRKKTGCEVTVGHVTAAVSCCLEMALWSTLWMADQVFLRVIGISHEVANEFPGMWARPTCGLEDERNEVDVVDICQICFFRSFGLKSRDGLQEKGATMDTSKYVTEPLRLQTRPVRACSVCPLTTRVRAGTSCSMDTFAQLCD